MLASRLYRSVPEGAGASRRAARRGTWGSSPFFAAGAVTLAAIVVQLSVRHHDARADRVLAEAAVLGYAVPMAVACGKSLIFAPAYNERDNALRMVEELVRHANDAVERAAAQG
jgi:hypothetical protein